MAGRPQLQHLPSSVQPADQGFRLLSDFVRVPAGRTAGLSSLSRMPNSSCMSVRAGAAGQLKQAVPMSLPGSMAQPASVSQRKLSQMATLRH